MEQRIVPIRMIDEDTREQAYGIAVETESGVFPIVSEYGPFEYSDPGARDEALECLLDGGLELISAPPAGGTH